MPTSIMQSLQASDNIWNNHHVILIRGVTPWGDPHLATLAPKYSMFASSWPNWELIPQESMMNSTKQQEDICPHPSCSPFQHLTTFWTITTWSLSGGWPPWSDPHLATSAPKYSMFASSWPNWELIPQESMMDSTKQQEPTCSQSSCSLFKQLLTFWTITMWSSLGGGVNPPPWGDPHLATLTQVVPSAIAPGLTGNSFF